MRFIEGLKSIHCHCKLSFFRFKKLIKKAKSEDSHLQHGENKGKGQGEGLLPCIGSISPKTLLRAKTQQKSER